MRIFRWTALLVFAVLPAAGISQECNLLTDSDAYISWEKYSGLERFLFIDNPSLHWVRLLWFYFVAPWGEGGVCWVQRSYIHFPVDQLPQCVGRAFLRLNFGDPRPSGVLVEIGAVEWDGMTALSWHGQPVPYWTTVVPLPSSGWLEVDVTEPVQSVISRARQHLAFVVRLLDEACPFFPSRGSRHANFTEPCLRIEPCIVNVEVKGLSDFEVTQPWISGNRYAPLGKLTVDISANVPYEVRACYAVSPEPDPPFSEDPVDIAYNWAWTELPRCVPDGSSFIPLPCFSGTPGTETCIFRVRVDLADLGDRAAGEQFTFTINVWAIPR